MIGETTRLSGDNPLSLHEEHSSEICRVYEPAGYDTLECNQINCSLTLAQHGLIQLLIYTKLFQENMYFLILCIKSKS